jgi:electron transport complex protein RnfB
MKPSEISNKINNVLPQTQCQLCDYPSCRDYANGIANNETTIDKCHPGGVNVLKKISAITKTPYEEYLPDVKNRHKPPSTVIIDEEICIGCTKCIQACPVDAIIGAPKKMHSIITQQCSGCDLCIPVCPVDCIITSKSDQLPNRDFLKSKYDAKNIRLENVEMQKKNKHDSNKLDDSSGDKNKTLEARKLAIAAALNRKKQ